MIRLNKVGTVAPKASKDIQHSRIGLGFEKLDRDVFDPEKAYPFVAQSGVKWARLQSGWQRTEREKGVYDFAWLDSVVDNMLAIGVEPWLCLCYGNDLYTEMAKEHFGAVGCVPIHSEEEKQAWRNYVHATVIHFKGRINRYEVWNEPDGLWCWKHGPSGKELGEFTIDTAAVCKAADPDCQVIGFCTCRTNRFHYIDELVETGVCDHIDSISYHSYKIHDQEFEDCYRYYENIAKKHNPKLTIIQGESGTQSRHDGCGALHGANWTPLKQAKFLLRHLMVDLACGAEFTSYFSCMDMIEALNGKVGDLNSYLDYGYFGVLGADFDENGRSTGDYTPKTSFKALQNLCSIFCEDYEQKPAPVENLQLKSGFVWGEDIDPKQLRISSWKKPNGAWAMCYWNTTSNVVTQTYEGTTSVRLMIHDAVDLRIVDLLTGDVYEIPESMMEVEKQFVVLKNIPVTDYPLLLTKGDFI